MVVVEAAAAVTVAKEKRGRLLCCFCLGFEHRLGDWIHFVPPLGHFFFFYLLDEDANNARALSPISAATWCCRASRSGGRKKPAAAAWWCWFREETTDLVRTSASSSSDSGAARATTILLSWRPWAWLARFGPWCWRGGVGWLGVGGGGDGMMWWAVKGALSLASLADSSIRRWPPIALHTRPQTPTKAHPVTLRTPPS